MGLALTAGAKKQKRSKQSPYVWLNWMVMKLYDFKIEVVSFGDRVAGLKKREKRFLNQAPVGLFDFEFDDQRFSFR